MQTSSGVSPLVKAPPGVGDEFQWCWCSKETQPLSTAEELVGSQKTSKYNMASHTQHYILEKAQGGEKFARDDCLWRRTLPAPPLVGLVQVEINKQGFSDLRVFLYRIFYLGDNVPASPLINSLTLD